MRKRLEKDIWHGLFDFYLMETSKPKRIDKLVAENISLKKLEVEKFIKENDLTVKDKSDLAKIFGFYNSLSNI